MLEMTRNGAGASDDAVAAGREDQRGVAGLGFGAGGRAASVGGVPDPELAEQAKRRTFTAEGRPGNFLVQRQARGFRGATHAPS